MESLDVAIAIRPGEHACCRLRHAEDRQRLAAAFVWDGLARSQKVVYLHDRDDEDQALRHLLSPGRDVAAARASGQLALCRTTDTYLRDGAFEIDRTLALIRDKHTEALAEGYAGLCLIGEMTWALAGAEGSDQLAAYEQQLGQLLEDRTLTLFCHYDHGRFAIPVLAEVADAHLVDVPPELATIGRDGRIAAAVIRPGRVLRLAGDLDFESSQSLTDVLDGHFHGPLSLDLADLAYVDVAGMRALRGRTGQDLMIVAASDAVHRLAPLLAWDTDPNIALPVG
jgi:anti-anti-sigma regulatory factor